MSSSSSLWEKMIPVLKQLGRADYEIPDDTWIHTLLDICTKETEEVEPAIGALETDFLPQLVDLIVSASGESLTWSLERRGDDDDEDCDFILRPSTISTQNLFKPDCFTFAVSLLFSFLRHARCFALLGKIFVRSTEVEAVAAAVEGEAAEAAAEAAAAASERLTLIDFVTKLICSETRWSDAYVRCGVFRALQPLVDAEDATADDVAADDADATATNDAASWLMCDAASYYYSRALHLHRDDASVFVRREAKAFLVRTIRRRAEKDLGSLTDRLLGQQRQDRRRVAEGLADCVLTAFYDPGNSPRSMDEIALWLKTFLEEDEDVIDGIGSPDGIRWDARVARFLWDAGAEADLFTKPDADRSGDKKFDALAQGFSKCISAVDAKFLRQDKSFFPSLLLLPLFSLDGDESRGWNNFDVDALSSSSSTTSFVSSSPPLRSAKLARTVTRACQSCRVAVSKGLRLEEEEPTVTLLFRLLDKALVRTEWPEFQLDASKLEAVCTSLTRLASTLVERRGSEIDKDKIGALASKSTITLDR